MPSARVTIKFKERNSNIKFKLFMLQFLGTGIKSILAFITQWNTPHAQRSNFWIFTR